MSIAICIRVQNKDIKALRVVLVTGIFQVFIGHFFNNPAGQCTTHGP
jgi:hypothetical protein